LWFLDKVAKRLGQAFLAHAGSTICVQAETTGDTGTRFATGRSLSGRQYEFHVSTSSRSTGSTDKQLRKLQGELDQARAGQAEAAACASDAEKRGVGAEAHLDGERAAKKTLETHVAELQGTVKRLEGEASRAGAPEAAAAGLRDQVHLLNETVAMLRGMLRQSGVEAPASQAPVATSKAAGGA